MQTVEILAPLLGEETPGPRPRAFRFHLLSVREKFSSYRSTNTQTIEWSALPELSPYLPLISNGKIQAVVEFNLTLMLLSLLRWSLTFQKLALK